MADAPLRSYPEIEDIISYIKSSNIYETEPKLQRWVSTLEGLHAPAQAVPDGWQLVPIELTDAMRWAGGSALHDEGEDTEGIWRAILKEAPSLPSTQRETPQI